MKYNARRMTWDNDELTADWDAECWSGLDTLVVANFRAEGSDHRPHVQAKLGHDESSLYGIFRVEDRYVRSIRTGFQESVCQDSCVEFFVQPPGGISYFNFEFNAGGAMLVFFVEDPTRSSNRFKKSTPLTDDECRQVRIVSSLPAIIEPEIIEPTVWTLAYGIPLSLLQRYAGDRATIAGLPWRANFYKCGDRTSHPHWASWMPLSELNFHLPQCFGKIEFCGSV